MSCLVDDSASDSGYISCSDSGYGSCSGSGLGHELGLALTRSSLKSTQSRPSAPQQIRTKSQLETSSLDALPDELVDCICRYTREIPALPTYETRSTWFWEPSSRYLLEMRFPQASSVVALRLVCKRLNRVATPYLWETLDIQLRHQVVKDEGCLSRSNSKIRRLDPSSIRRSRNSTHILEYVASNPEIAAMVRVLCLRVSGYTFAALARGESEGDLEKLIERLLTQTKALTAFCIDKADLLTPLATSKLLVCRSLRLVDLRTVGFRGEGLQMFSGEELPVLEHFGLSVFNLAYKSLKLPRNLKRVSLHCDSMSTFVREEAPILDEQICPETIEELAIFDKHGDVALFVSKHFASARALKQQIALKELFLDLEWCHATRLNKILSNFRSESVERLTMRNLHRMAPRGLSDLAEYFPNVRQLALSSSTTDIVPAWIVGCFHEYIEALKCLKMLESLEWDNSALCYFAETEETSGACETSLAALVKLPTLKTVRMISFSSRTVSTCTVRRSERGEYSGYESSKTDIFPDFEASQRLITSLYK
ncbi:hypothetical protein ACEPAH_7559 [Sanghuangporus vaninii]